MIYRLVARGTVEERVLQKAKKKMMLEEIVVRRLDKKYSMNKEELEDIVKYGTSKLFCEDPEGTQDQLGYSDEALEELLDRERHMQDSNTSEDEPSQGGWLTSFNVAQLAEATQEDEGAVNVAQLADDSEDEDGVPAE